MKVFVQYTQTGMYKDQSWSAPTLRTKGQLHAVEPSEAFQLIKHNKASLHKNENDEIVFDG
jgi:hypothetical protein